MGWQEFSAGGGDDFMGDRGGGRGYETSLASKSEGVNAGIGLAEKPAASGKLPCPLFFQNSSHVCIGGRRSVAAKGPEEICQRLPRRGRFIML